jgi:hypothetical protein
MKIEIGTKKQLKLYQKVWNELKNIKQTIWIITTNKPEEVS